MKNCKRQMLSYCIFNKSYKIQVVNTTQIFVRKKNLQGFDLLTTIFNKAKNISSICRGSKKSQNNSKASHFEVEWISKACERLKKITNCATFISLICKHRCRSVHNKKETCIILETHLHYKFCLFRWQIMQMFKMQNQVG